MKTEQNKLSVETLVTIGDALHNSKCAFVLAQNETDNINEVEATCLVYGGRKNLYNMFYNVIYKNKDIEQLLTEVLKKVLIDKIEKKILHE